MATQGRKVQSIEKASTLLDCFWTAQQPLALSELVQMTGWAKSTIHGILSTMVDCAMVEQNPFDGKYRLGYHLFELGSAVHHSWNAVTVSKPYLLNLVATLNESAYLARLTGDELLLADCAEPHIGFRVSSEAGTRMPLHCTSQGKAILAFHPESEAKMLLRHKEMIAYTKNTITNWDDFRLQLNSVRDTGIAVECEEYKLGLQSMAAPIFDNYGECNYAIGIVGLLHSDDQNYYDYTAKVLRETARSVSHDLGFRDGPYYRKKI